MYSRVRQLIRHYNRDPLNDYSESECMENKYGVDFFSEFKAKHELKSKIKKQVAEKFIHSLHMPVFEKVSRENNVAISVREAGENTIKGLGDGAAAKGHNILEKTIKRSSLSQIYKSASDVDEVLKEIEKCGFVGKVGRWGFSGLSGIYAYNNISDTDMTYDIDFKDPKNHELLNEWIKRRLVIPYTGDYDVHDIIYFEDGVGVIPEADSKKENEIKDKINALVAEGDPARPFDKKVMNVIRHGPQVNFVPYMWQHEPETVKKDNGYLANVASPGPFPIAMVYKGEWQIFYEKEELFNFYKMTNTPLPEHWTTEFVDRGNGYVATPAHAILLDEIRSKSTG